MGDATSSNNQVAEITRAFIKGIKTRNLAPLKDRRVDKDQILALARKEMPESQITTTIKNSINAGINDVGRGLDAVQALLASYDNLKYEFWLQEDLSGNGPPRNSVTIYYSTQNSCLSINFHTIVCEGQNFLFGKIKTDIHAPVMQRAIKWRGEDYDRFLSEHKWIAELPELLAQSNFKQVIDYYNSLDPSNDDWNDKVKFTKPVTDEVLKELESKLGRSITAELVNWWNKEGFSRVGDTYDPGSFEIFSPDRIQSIVKDKGYKHVIKSMGMAEVLEEFHAQDEFKNVLGEKDYHRLNKKYMIIAWFGQGDSDGYYIYADERGQFGLLEYRHDFGSDSWHAEFTTLLTTSRANANLDNCIANFLKLSTYEVWQKAIDQ